MQASILFTGGAGYIASHTIQELLKRYPNYQIIVIDNLSRSSIDFVPKQVKFYHIDLLDLLSLEKIFKEHKIDLIVHNAAKIDVQEGELKPWFYYENNVAVTRHLLLFMEMYKIDKLVFSSSAAVYGEQERLPIKENNPLYPSNVYGKSKLRSEYLIQSRQDKINSIIFRFFNVAGVDLELGRYLKNAENVIGILMKKIQRNDVFQIFGKNYPSKDGSPVRDFIHVKDIALAQVKAIEFLLNEKLNNFCEVFNLSRSEASSILDLVKIAEEITAKKVNYELLDGRPADIAISYADASKAEKILKWRAKYDLYDILKDEWKYINNN